jgi:ArsR family transcriptional regulator
MTDDDQVSRATTCCGGVGEWLDADDARVLADRLAAVADPVRLQILSIISRAPSGEICACDFVEPIGKSQPTISHHLKVLSEAGLVDGDKRGRWVWYRLRPQEVADLLSALGDNVARRSIAS